MFAHFEARKKPASFNVPIIFFALGLALLNMLETKINFAPKFAARCNSPILCAEAEKMRLLVRVL